MAPQESDTRSFFVVREPIIKDVFDYLHAGGQVVLVTGQHLMGKTPLLEEMVRRMREDEPRLYPGMFGLRFHDAIFSPYLEATAKVLDVIVEPPKTKKVKYKTKKVAHKTASFFKALINNSDWKKIGVALCRDLAGMVKAGKTAEALTKMVKDAADAADVGQSIASLIQDRQPVMMTLVNLLAEMVEMVGPEDRLVLFLDQVERGGEPFRDLMSDLLWNLPKGVSLVVGNNVGTPSGIEFKNKLAPSLADKSPLEIELPPLTADEIGQLVAETKGIELEKFFLNQVARKSKGLLGFIIPWMESEDFEAKKYTDPGDVRKGPYIYYKEMVENVAPEPRKVAERLSLLSGPLPEGLEDVGQLFDQDVYWADDQIRALESGGIFKRFMDRDESWFANDLLAAFVRDEWVRSKTRKKHAEKLRNYLEGKKYKDKLTLPDNVSLFADHAELLRITGTPSEVWYAYTALAEYYKNTAYYGLAEEAVDIAQASAEEEARQELDQNKQKENNRRRAICFNILGNIKQSRGEYDRALEFYEQAQQVFEEIDHRAGMAATYNNLGFLYQARGEYERALEFYKKAIPIKEEISDRAGMAETYNNLGGVHQARGEYDRALEFYEQAQQVFEEIDHRAGMSVTYNNLGLLYQARGEHERALEFYKKAIPIKEEIGDRAGIAATYNNFGLVHHARGEYDKALEFYYQAQQVFEEIGQRVGMAWAYDNIATGYLFQGEYDRALEFYFQAWPVMEQVGDNAGLAGTFLNIGLSFSEQSRSDEAAPYALAALTVFKSLGPNPNTENAEKLASYLIEKLGRDGFQQAIDKAPPELKKYLPEKIEFESEE